MGFLDETIKALELDLNDKSQAFCYLAPEKGIIIEGYKKIYELSAAKITLMLISGKQIEIIGENLSIKEIAHQEISILGAIKSINFV